MPRRAIRMRIDITRHRKILRALWALWLAGVLWGSLISQSRMESLDRVVPMLEVSDKLVHFAAYAGLALLSLLAFERRRGTLVALSMIPLGGLVEFAQRLAPGRTPDIMDALANCLGVLLGTTLGVLFVSRRSGSIPPEFRNAPSNVSMRPGG